MVSTKQFLVTAAFMLSYFASFAFGQSFEGNTVLNGLTIFILPVKIASGANLVIKSGLIHNFFNTITNRGGLYICETKSSNIGMTIISIDNVFNYGTYVIDDSLASTGLIYENFGNEFFNSGEMYLVSKKPLITGSDYRIWAITFHNEGLLAFYNKGTSNFLTNVHLGPNLYLDLWHIWNDGTICLQGVNLHARVAFEGEEGCIDVGEYATFTVNNIITRSVKSQTVYMSSETSIVYVKSLLGLTSLTVRGFGNTNAIYFQLPVLYYTYNTASGILTVIDGLDLIRIDIGAGYDMSQMFRITHHIWIGAGVVYNGDVPDTSRPSNCAECTEAPSCDDALNGKSSVTTASNTYTNTDLPSPYTTTVSASGTTETQLISFYWTTDANGSTYIVETVYTLTGSAASSLDAESKTVSAASSVESSVAASSAASSVESSSVAASSAASSVESSVASSAASSSASSSASGSLSYYTTTKSDATTTETLVISDYTTTDNNGNTITMESTYTITASQAPLTTYTTTVVVDGTTSVYVVCDYTTTDANGNTVTLVSSYPCITDGTATTYTRTITAEICTSTVVVCTCTSTKSNGETVSTLTTYPATYTPTDMSGDSYTTTVVVGGTVTEVVECDYLTTDSAGNTYTAHSTVTETSLTTTTETVCETCTATATAAAAKDTDSTTTVTNTSVATKTASPVVSQAAKATSSAAIASYEGAAANLAIGGSWIAMISAFVFLL
ncbi:similar to Kazachstania africana KAFR_0I01780 hypothetical protein [Maudiozyma saulgeensis]|uniref:Hyphally-regulated cell wall protein N-terminal domain-containing protein n=1 Tax=Maudiozyma saulgeensis TaxID=1789683 RepID=A0A1X7QY28_9SACH|nr:similar to Kazachstania africana KAFR_0I01780 hypothetical protein [Kazachstania saulgeensis]